jgi:hypothetical protein
MFCIKKTSVADPGCYPGFEFFHPGFRVKKILDPGAGAASKNYF